ncbi:MAG TPA: TraR/DksA C4-type zinc finger protein [Candidatus Limnocylindrales bacterium]|nr:TraR/DksA C4-type zinc finger protein [Candidatus Limnocylindrales bacterium]
MATSFDESAARSSLLAERDRLRAELGEPIEAPGQMTYGSQAAAASHVFEQQRDLALRDRSRAELGRVEAALQRLDDGTYGVCESCGNPIAPERLEAIPWAPLCIDCARKGTPR